MNGENTHFFDDIDKFLIILPLKLVENRSTYGLSESLFFSEVQENPFEFQHISQAGFQLDQRLLSLKNDSLDEVLLDIEKQPPQIEDGLKVQPSPKNKKSKNSNTIKKIGRMILNNLHRFERQNIKNKGVEIMLKQLKQKSSSRGKPKDFRDSFNFSHLESLVSNRNEQESSHNLKVCKTLFDRQLRREVLSSFQIKENKLMYLNSMKCSALRFCSKRLALRLQLADCS